jgi:hypothetical protein
MTAVVYLGALAGYLAAAALALWVTWRLTRSIHAPWLRICIRSAAIALLFSPTIFACGAYTPVPFPLLLASDVLQSHSPCNLGHYQVVWNAVHVVAPIWVLLLGAWLLRTWLTTAPSNNRWRGP